LNEGGKPSIRAGGLKPKMFTLGLLLGLSQTQIKEAHNMFLAVAYHPQWTSVRSNDALMVDCYYEIGKRYGLTQKRVIDVTVDAFDKGTQPKPHLWREFYENICAVV
jgi:hypothetical protein